MADSDLSLLFRLRAENSQAKAVMNDTRQAVTALRSSFGSDLKQMQTVAQSALSDISDHVNAFVGQRIPLIGGAFLRVTSNLRGLNDELKRGGPQTAALSQQIESIARSSGKSTAEVARFLTTFTRLEGQAARNEAAFKFFGGSVDLIGNKTAKFLPELESAGSELAQVSTAAESAGGAMAGMAGPIGIAVVALAAEIVVVVSLTKEIYNLTKATADYQGKLFDLSQQTGVSVETLSALEIAAAKTGGSIEGLVQSLGIFQKSLEDAVEDRGSKASVAFQKLGVDARDTETALRQTVAALAKMSEGFQQTSLARDVFGGRGAKNFLAIAKETNGDIDRIVERMSKLGGVTTEQARLADEFNDKLKDLEFQLRGIGTQAIPVVLDILQSLSKELETNRDLFNALQGIVKAVALTISVPLKGALGILRDELTAARVILAFTADQFERIKAAIEFISGHPIKLPSFTGETPTAAPTTSPSAPQIDPFIEGIKDEIEARKRLQGVLNFEFAQRQQQAQDSIALAQREFEAGRLTREGLLQATILGNRKKAQAEIDALEVERGIKLKEIALAQNDIQKRDQISAAILAIDSQIANRRADLQKTQKDLTAKSQLEERKDLLAHQQAQLEILRKAAAERIAVIEDEIKAGVTSRKKGIDQIEQLENAALVARGQLLKRELEMAGVGPERQAVLDKIAAIEVDRSELQRAQSARRIGIAQQEASETASILTAEAETLLQIGQITDASRIAALKSLAALRVGTEKETEEAILKIQLDAIDRQDDAAKIRDAIARKEIDARLGAIQEARRSLDAQLTAVGGIADPTKRAEEQVRLAAALKQNVNEEIVAQGQANKDRNRLDKELNSQLRINNTERLAIQSQGERNIEEGRQRDLDNERRYADELRNIQERIRRTEQDSANEVIRLMVLHFANRKDIIRARVQQDIADENQRHRQAEETIRNLDRENRESTKTQQEKLEAEHEINLLREAEAERHRLAMQGIKDQGKKDQDEASPLGRIGLGTDDLKEFASVIENSIVPLGEILKNTFLQVADAIGQTIQNWVLLGETGPAVMRKILAQALASIAAEAAVNAIKELAIGFATLFFNPAESAAHFTAAALWGSIAGVSAIAGRAVAGDLFKSKGAAGGGAGSSQRDSPQSLNPIVQGRNQQQTINIVLHQDIKTDGGQIVKTWVDDFSNGGITREVVNTDGR